MRALTAITALLLVLAGCSNDSTSATTTTTTTRPTTTTEAPELTLEWSGTAPGVDLTIGIDTQISQMTGKANNQSMTLPAPRRGTFVQLMIQNQGATGTVACEITLDGTRLATNQSSGAYVITTCDATIP